MPDIEKQRSRIRMHVQVVSALRWTAVFRFSGQLLSWALTLIVIRLLTPEDYGLMAVASIFVGLATLINELGVIPALIQTNYASTIVIRKIFGFIILLNAIMVAFIFIISPYISDYFEDENLTIAIRILSVQLIISSISYVPIALLHKKLQFKLISAAEFSAIVLAGIATLVLALKGYGVWSLIFGVLFREFVKSFVIIVITKFHMVPLFYFSGLKHIFQFGIQITGQRILWYFNKQIPIIFISKILGSEMTGFYSVATNISEMPMAKTLDIIQSIALPAYARVQDDLTRARSYCFRTIEFSALLTFPILWGLASISSEFTSVVLGETWDELAEILGILCFVTSVRIVTAFVCIPVNGLGRPDVGLRNTLTMALCVPTSIVVGINWGLIGACVALSIGVLFASIINCKRSLEVIESGLRALVPLVFSSMFNAAAMYAFVILLKTYVFAEFPELTRMVICIVIGFFVYLFLTITLNRVILLRLLRLIWMN